MLFKTPHVLNTIYFLQGYCTDALSFHNALVPCPSYPLASVATLDLYQDTVEFGYIRRREDPEDPFLEPRPSLFHLLMFLY